MLYIAKVKNKFIHTLIKHTDISNPAFKKICVTNTFLASSIQSLLFADSDSQKNNKATKLDKFLTKSKKQLKTTKKCQEIE